MNTILQPIAITKVDWKEYIKIFQDVLGKSPTRELDAANIPLTDAAAFLATLGGEKIPVENLRKVGTSFNHFMVSMVTLIDSDFYLILTSQTYLRIIPWQAKKQYLCLISGTMKEWHDSIIRSLDIQLFTDTNSELRFFMNLVLETFERLGFKEVWSKYQKVYHIDNSFSLKTT
jgi:hypothetical protein